MQKHFVLATTTLNQVSLRPSGYKRLLVSFTVKIHLPSHWLEVYLYNCANQ